jgi:hypothetical protein
LGFTLFHIAWYVFYDPATVGNPTVEVPSDTTPAETPVSGPSIPTDSELLELSMFDMLHPSDLLNPILLEKELFEDS